MLVRQQRAGRAKVVLGLAVVVILIGLAGAGAVLSGLVKLPWPKPGPATNAAIG